MHPLSDALASLSCPVASSIVARGLLTAKDVAGSGTTIWSATDANTSLYYARKSGKGPGGSMWMFRVRALTPSDQGGYTTVKRSDHMDPQYLVEFRAATVPIVPRCMDSFLRALVVTTVTVLSVACWGAWLW